MTPQRARHALLLLTTAGALCLGAVSASARNGDDRDSGWSRDWGPHPTLPAPAALVFGGIAVSAALAAARRRKSKHDLESPQDDESGGDSK